MRLKDALLQLTTGIAGAATRGPGTVVLSKQHYQRELETYKRTAAKNLLHFLGNPDVAKQYRYTQLEPVWVDLFHAPYDWNRQSVLDNMMTYRPDPTGIAKQAWQWFLANGFTFSPHVFARSETLNLLIVASDDRLSTNAVAEDAVKVVSIPKSLFEPLEQLYAFEGRFPAEVELSPVLNELRTRAEYGKVVEAIRDIFGTGIADRSRIHHTFVNYLVVTYFNLKGLSGFTSGEKHFYYVYYPALPRVQRVVSGTVVGFEGVTEDVLPFLLLEGPVSLWARYAHVSEERRALLERSHRAAVAALMSRNLSHNVGSHALANPRLYEAIGIDGLDSELLANANCGDCKDHARKNPLQEAKTKLSTFHQYTQARLDFIARTLNPQIERPEPLFFINDVMNGFFRQAVLLETLLADRGFTASGNTGSGKRAGEARAIKFHIDIDVDAQNGANKQAEQQAKPKKYSFALAGKHGKERRVLRAEPGVNVEDVLIGIPGGMIGCQALYSFIENVMRNTAKYGKNCDSAPDLQIHLRLRNAAICDLADKSEQFFVLEVWENLSDDPSPYASTGPIRHHLGRGIVDELGKTVTQGQGIQEMKIAAEFLGGSEKFLHDSDCGAVPKSASGECPYCCFVRGANEFNKSLKPEEKKLKEIPIIADPQPLRCFVKRQQKIGKEQNAIVYQLLVPKARLVGIVKCDLAPAADGRHAQGSQSIFYHKDVISLAKHGAAFGVILDHYGINIETTVEAIVENHHALPFRLLVLCANDERRAEWYRNIRVAQMRAGYSDGAFSPATQLPTRRLHFIAHEELHREFLAGLTRITQGDFLGAKRWEARILQLYHLWLAEFKGIPAAGAWKLVIGFQREAGQVSRRWSDGRSKFSADEQKRLSPETPMHIEIEVVESEDAKAELPSDFLNADLQCRRAYLVFDNHAQAIPRMHNLPLDDGPRFYQDFQGNRELSLAQILESPPQGEFSFPYWIYSLVEGALVNVAIVDERVATAGLIDDQATELKKLGVIPVFRVSRGGDTKYIPPAAEQYATDNGDDFMLAPTPKLRWSYRSAENRVKVAEIPASLRRSGEVRPPIENLDAIIIHEGVIDTLLGNLWKRDEAELLAIAPRIIRTSGRGSTPRHLDFRLPFMEFSELSDTIYQSRNKPALAKAVCSVAGPFARGDASAP